MEKNINTYLSFMIDNEYFAVNVAKVLEVLLTQKITRVPNVSEEIRGVINFRGEIIPLFETRTVFNLPDRTDTDRFVIIVLEITTASGNSVIGAVVDRVKDVIEIEPKSIMPVPKMNIRIKAELISGIYKLKEDFVMLLNVDKMFSDEEIELMNNLAVLPTEKTT